jgi:hypothetical protein
LADFEVLTRNEVRFERTLTTPLLKAWAMLSDGRRLAKWFLPVTSFEAALGGSYTIPSDSGSLDGVLTQFEAPHLINFGGNLRFELTESAPDTTLLRFTLFRNAIGWIPSTLASYATMLDNLERLLSGDHVFERPAYMQAWRLHYPVCEQAISTALASGSPVIYRLSFPSGEDKLPGDVVDQPEFQQVVTLLRQRRNLHLAIDGFADEPLDRAKAFRLSQRRADSAKAHLVAAGIASERITTRAFGNYYRLHASRDEASTHLNRRVELIPLY